MLQNQKCIQNIWRYFPAAALNGNAPQARYYILHQRTMLSDLVGLVNAEDREEAAEPPRSCRIVEL